jgi:hypothetical protein
MNTFNERLVLEKDGSLYIETLERTAVNGDFKQALVADEARKIIRVSPELADVPFGKLHVIITADSSTPIQYAAVKLTHLNFHTRWNVTLDGISPVPNSVGNPPGATINPATTQQTLLWQIPDNMDAWLVVYLPTASLSLATFVDGVLCNLPLPNMWSDTRLCWKLPDLLNPSVPSGLVDKITFVYTEWVHSIWNKDLYQIAFSEVFQWNTDGTQRDRPLQTTTPANIPVELLPVYAALPRREGAQ